MWSDSLFANVNAPDPYKMFLCARLCQAVYPNAKGIESIPGVTAATPITLSATLGPIWKVTIGGENVCIFAGTNSGIQLAQQFLGGGFPQALGSPLGAYVNSYQYSLQDSVWPLVPTDCTVLMGHSLGGALAVYEANRLKAAGINVKGVVTFGCPRMMNASALPLFPFQPVVHCYNPYDPVPRCPQEGYGLLHWFSPGNYVRVNGDHSITPTLQPPADPDTVATLFLATGDSWHAAGTYIQLLNTVAPVVSTAAPGPPKATPLQSSLAMPNVIVEFKVRGVLNGQSVQNITNWVANDGAGHNNIALDLRGNWRSNILPRVSLDYSVIAYDYRQIVGMVFKDPTNAAAGSLFRFANVIRLGGVGLDVGGRSAGANLPSNIAVGAAKACVGWTKSDLVTPPATLEKQPKGSIRFAGLLETDTVDSGNSLDPSVKALWQTAVDQFRAPGGGTTPVLAVITNRTGKAVLTDPGPPVTPIFYVSLVSSLAVNPYVTSQNSRKQSLSRLG